MDLNKSRASRGLLRSPVSPTETPPLPSISPEGKGKADKLIDQVSSILLSDDVITSKALEPYVRWCHDACSNSDILKYAVERLHYYWLSERAAVIKSALFLHANWMFEVDGLKLRQEVLSCLQRDFESRLDVQAKSPEKFLNAAAFLVEMFTRIRIENLPMTFMTTPVFQYLEDLLTGDDSEIELFAHLIIGIASTLEEAHADGDSLLSSFSPLQSTFSKVRSTLTSRNLSSQSRLWLLFIMDVSSTGNFRPPSSILQSFYRDQENLGTSVDTLLKTLESNSDSEQITTTPEPRRQESVEEKVSIHNELAEIKISPKPVGKETVENTDSSGANKKSPGRNEVLDKRESFRSAFHVDRSKGNKGKSYWLHDDRFENDDRYEEEKSLVKSSKPRASESNWRRPSTPKDEKEGRPSNSGSWRQSQQREQWDNAIKTPHNASVNTLAGHVQEEVWD